MVKMYELDTTEAQAEAATAAAVEFRAYVVSLIEERRRVPRDELVTRLVKARIEGERLTDAQIVSTIIVLLNAGHEATVNTLGNGVLYASALVGEQTQMLLDRGRKFCFLYTDLANPTSNSIYQRIGYRPVGDADQWIFSVPNRSASRRAASP